MITESFQNYRELSRAGEPFLTVGIGVALPFLNPRMSAIGIDLYRNFRLLDNQVEEEQNPFLKKAKVESEIEEVQCRANDSMFRCIFQRNDEYLERMVLSALDAMVREQELEANFFPVDDDEIYDIKLGNALPYQVLAAYLLFGKKIDLNAKGVEYFISLAGLLQNGDDLRDLGQDIFNHKLHFTKEEKARMINGNRFNIAGVFFETIINFGQATAMVARARRMPELPNWLAKVWAFATYTKITVDALATISPLNLYRLSKIRFTDAIIRNI